MAAPGPRPLPARPQLGDGCPRHGPFPFFFLLPVLFEEPGGDRQVVKPEPRAAPGHQPGGRRGGARRPTGTGTAPGGSPSPPAHAGADTRILHAHPGPQRWSPSQNPAGSASGRGDPPLGPGGDTSVLWGRDGATHPGGAGSPLVQPARGPHRSHPTAPPPGCPHGAQRPLLPCCWPWGRHRGRGPCGEEPTSHTRFPHKRGKFHPVFTSPPARDGLQVAAAALLGWRR